MKPGKGPQRRYRVGAPSPEFIPDPDLELLVKDWYDLPARLRRQIVELHRFWHRDERP
jgi:hypothetical protein